MIGHKVAHCVLGRLHILSPGPGTHAREGKPPESSASPPGTQPVCPLRSSSAKMCRRSPLSLSAGSRSDVLKQADATCSLQPQPRPASHPASRRLDQPHLWLLGNKSTWRQLALLPTGGSSRVVCGRKPEKDVNSGLTAFWREKRVCVFGGRVSRHLHTVISILYLASRQMNTIGRTCPLTLTTGPQPQETFTPTLHPPVVRP